MAIVIKAKKNQNTSDLIRQFRKQTALTDVVQIVKDRRYFKKPSREKAEKVIYINRLRKRARSLKRMKNISPQVIVRINEKLGSS